MYTNQDAPRHFEPALRIFTTRQFAQLIQVSIATVKRMCDRGELACIVVSERGDRRIPAAELDRLLHQAAVNRSAVEE